MYTILTTQSQIQPDEPARTNGSAGTRPWFAGWPLLVLASIGVLLLGGLANDYLAGGALLAIGEDLGWFATAAIATCTLAGALCFSKWRFEWARSLGATFVLIGIGTLFVAAAYEPDSDGGWRRFALAVWSAIPLSIAMWGHTALVMVEETKPRRSDEPTVRVMQARGRATQAEIRVGWLSLSVLEAIVVWVPALFLGAASLIPGLLHEISGHAPEAWQGWTYSVEWPIYLLLPLWGGVVLTGAIALLEVARRAHSNDLPAGVVLRARVASRVALLGSLVAAFIFAGSASQVWAQPVLNLAMSVFALCLALAAIETTLYEQEELRLVPLGRQLAASLIVVSVALLIVVTCGATPVGGALAAAAVVGLIPALPWFADTLPFRKPRPRHTSTFTASADELGQWLASYSLDSEPPVRRADVEKILELLQLITPDGLRRLIGASPDSRGTLKSGGQDALTDPALERLLDELPPLAAKQTIGDQLGELARLVRLTILGYPGATRRRGTNVNLDDPSPRWILATYCLNRRISTATSADQHDQEDCDLLRYGIWHRSGPNGPHDDGRPTYRFYGTTVNNDPRLVAIPLSDMNATELREAYAKVSGRRTRERVSAAKRSGNDRGCEIVLEHWISRLQALL